MTHPPIENVPVFARCPECGQSFRGLIPWANRPACFHNRCHGAERRCCLAGSGPTVRAEGARCPRCPHCPRNPPTSMNPSNQGDSHLRWVSPLSPSPCAISGSGTSAGVLQQHLDEAALQHAARTPLTTSRGAHRCVPDAPGAAVGSCGPAWGRMGYRDVRRSTSSLQ